MYRKTKSVLNLKDLGVDRLLYKNTFDFEL